MTRVLTAFLLACTLIGTSATSARADDNRTERVQFPKGNFGTTIKGSITGRETVDYKLGARAGQGMIARLKTNNQSNYFNILAPGETDVAFFVGSTKGVRFDGDLPASGDYTIRVYLMRNAARRGETANYSLEVAIAAVDETSSETGGTSTTKPSFDCAKAGSDVETLICRDAVLAQLDRSLSGLYAVLLKNSPKSEQKKLKAEQRGWVKGRDNCWKSADMRGCVAGEYRSRIDELKDR